MKTGSSSTYVISWAQTEIDGLSGAPVASLGVGASWRWTGKPLRLDGPQEILLLKQADGEADMRRRAARMVHKLVGAAMQPGIAPELVEPDDTYLNMGFEVTDGHASYTVTLVETSSQTQPLLAFIGEVPPANEDLWVVRASIKPSSVNRMLDQPTGVICFTPQTRLRTAQSDILVSDLKEGDEIQTRDNGTQKVLWIGHRRITGARLFAMPELRPIRLRAGSICAGQPDEDLLVSPQHQILLNGPRAQELFNTDEVLVSARDLVDERRIVVDTHIREVTYYHVLLENHEVVWANGVPAESFHPANTDLETVENSQRMRLFDMFPELDYDPNAYGAFARRSLNPGEAAIMRGDVA